jgi:phospholipid transport system substrate-binding protein
MPPVHYVHYPETQSRRTMYRRQFLIALLCVLAAVANTAHAAAGPSPTETVDRLQTTLISVMKEGQKLGYEGRHKRLKPVIEETHNLQAIAQVAAGRFWNDFTPDQRRRYVDAFSELSVATYADRFDGYSGESFKTQSERKLENGDVLVQSVLAERGGGTTRFDYILRNREGHWSIVNIVAEGVSDLAIKRAEYSSVLRDQGVDALIARIREKTAAYEKKK